MITYSSQKAEDNYSKKSHTCENLYSEDCQSPEPKKIILSADLLIGYMTEEDDSKLNLYLHEILRLTYLKEITCYVFEEDVDREFDLIVTDEILPHLNERYLSKTTEENCDKTLDLRRKVLDKIKEIISNDIILCKESDVTLNVTNDLNIVSKLNRGLTTNFSLLTKIIFHRQMYFQSIVIESDKPLTHFCKDINADGWNIRIDNPKSFIESSMSGFNCISSSNVSKINEISVDDISKANDEFAQIAKLNQLIGVEPVCEPFLIKELGNGWHFIDFEVMTTNQCAVIAKIKLWNKDYDRDFIFTGTGNGVIDAILSAVDDAVKYMTEQRIIQNPLPNKSDIFSFLITDRDDNVQAKVECKIIFKVDEKHYMARGYHSDTVKSVLYAYASVLHKIIKDEYCEYNSWIVDSETIQYLYYRKEKKNFKNLKGIDLVLRGDKNSSNEKSGLMHKDNMCFDSSKFNTISIYQDYHYGSSWYEVESEEVNLSNSEFYFADFSQTKFGNITVKNCVFFAGKMQGIVWGSSTIANTKLTGITLNNADLSNAQLYNVNLRDANLTGANLSNADFKNVDLTNANLMDANLTNADLRGVNLTNTNLIGANLTNANLVGANLTDAILDSSIAL
jgi:uncharacterized protein YjbI with pentapeptide repeats